MSIAELKAFLMEKLKFSAKGFVNTRQTVASEESGSLANSMMPQCEESSFVFPEMYQLNMRRTQDTFVA